MNFDKKIHSVRHSAENPTRFEYVGSQEVDILLKYPQMTPVKGFLTARNISDQKCDLYGGLKKIGQLSWNSFCLVLVAWIMKDVTQNQSYEWFTRLYLLEERGQKFVPSCLIF